MLTPKTKTAIMDFAKECQSEHILEKGDIVITGGCELGHAKEMNVGSHGVGHKFDIRPTKVVVNRIINNPEIYKQVKENQWVDVRNGQVWVREDTHTENDHFDVEVKQ